MVSFDPRSSLSIVKDSTQMPLYMLYTNNFQQDYANDYLTIVGFADIILTNITAGQKIDDMQKVSLSHYTCYMVHFTI